ncbi:MAG: pilus assembly protein PilC [Planctomycetaceae bacterium]|nr:pilus assembly protein PilC [Planctomycetaceae bacterium]
MPTYQYEAMDQTGKTVKDTIDAASNDDALAKIKNQGLFPTSVRERRTRQRGGGASAAPTPTVGRKKSISDISINIGGVGTKKLSLFTRQLSTLQDAGLPILRSLQILALQQKPGLLKNTLEAVAVDVEGGTSLSEAMERHPKAFDRLYVKMIAAGEVSGTLDVILQRLADFMEKAQKLKSKIRGAMVYPVVVMVVAVLIVTGIMVFVVPKFGEIFADFDAKMPATTQFLITASYWISGVGPDGQMSAEDDNPMIPGWAWIIVSPFLIWGFMKLMGQSKGGRKFTDEFKLYIPVFGKLLRFTCIARFTRTLGTLVHAGVPILEAMLITRDTVGNNKFEVALQKVHDSIREGETISQPLRESKIADELVVNMIDVGEETGELDKMLMKVADNYDEAVDTTVGALVSILEPIMVVMLGGIVGFIVISLFLPMVAIVDTLAQAG